LGQESDQTRAKEFKVADYMVKVNFSLEEVVAKIKEHLAKK
jgi:DNA-binding response OmpR family regulator